MPGTGLNAEETTKKMSSQSTEKERSAGHCSISIVRRVTTELHG
jgi:hypothetical protein